MIQTTHKFGSQQRAQRLDQLNKIKIGLPKEACRSVPTEARPDRSLPYVSMYLYYMHLGCGSKPKAHPGARGWIDSAPTLHRQMTFFPYLFLADESRNGIPQRGN